MVPLLILILSCLIEVSQSLQVGFYANTCPNAESIVRRVVSEAAASEPRIPPILLRLHFHDCFVHGCDGSILIDTGLVTEENHASGHDGVGGADVIARAKAELEAACPGIVSCADIVALAARDAVVLTNGPMYEVPTGRRDGLVSNISLAADMPDVTDSIDTLKAKFLQKGLLEKELVILSSAHTIGTTACFFMTKRLYEFFEGSGSDPSINPEFLPELKAACPQGGNSNSRLPMDRGSGQTFDNQILQNIRSGFAVLQTDARLYEDAATKTVVDSYFGLFGPFAGPSFEADFAKAMVKMGKIGVLKGSNGEIRRVCSAFN
ncbi:peroxidase 43-like [Olea europaea subsp. europaea]|uniref:Peroxidase n=1 Tax=Olea europaea subsp. europaea TaxID=158383 RepID=A0A8S0PAD7_OLEEU|nr:peroxidase 43-like [Olea europaea subsp. europaea]